MFRIPRLPAMIASVVLAVAACSDSSQPPTSPSPPNDPLFRSGQQPPHPNTLARGVRGFGGFFLDHQGSPTIWLKQPAERGNAEQALEPWFRATGRAVSGLRVLRGDYDWGELQGWFPAASAAAFALPGTVFVDADEAANRIRVAVVHGASIGAIRAALERAGIPPDAVAITEREPIRPLATLRDAVRPTLGGLQINFDPDPGTPGSFACTLSFNVLVGGQRSFITPSHCTNEQGSLEGTGYGQPLLSVSGVIATEVDDPEYFRRGCYASFLCRYSDASRAAYAAGTPSVLGSIARTAAPNARGGANLTIAGEFHISAEDLNTEHVVGSELNKVGRTTGWTRGPVTLTCVDVLQSGSRFVELCQTFVRAGVAGGDSGSPVFAEEGGGNVTLAGILWGGGGGDFVFSPLANIERELGPLQTH
jgi:hypothetical protein